MTIEAAKKFSQHVCRLLKVPDILFPIGRTGKGNLAIVFEANKNDFRIMLDSVPLSTHDFLNDENNIELKKMIEKYWFEESITSELQKQGDRIAIETLDKGFTANPLPEPKKKRGRPVGSKNK